MLGNAAATISLVVIGFAIGGYEQPADGTLPSSVTPIFAHPCPAALQTRHVSCGDHGFRGGTATLFL
jgi:hypothetical protein